MVRHMILAVAAGASILMPCSTLLADVQSDFEQLFGADARKVVATSDTRDDAEFAATMLAAARSASASPALQALLCEKAYEFGIKSVNSSQTAVEAMTILAQSSPEKKAQCQEKVLAVWQVLYARGTGQPKQQAGEEMLSILVELGDRRVEERKSAEAAQLYQRALAVAGNLRSDRASEIQAKLKEVLPRQKTEQKVDQLKARLERDPQDTAARTELVLIYVAEYDDITQAQKLLDRDVDETVRTYVPLAAKDVSEVPEAVCLELGDWYRKLADTATLQGKKIVLSRSCRYYTRFIETHAQTDAPMLMAKKSLSEVQNALKAVEEKLSGGEAEFAALLKEVRIVSEGHNAGDRVGISVRGKVVVQGAGEENRGLTMVAVNRGKVSPPVSFDTSASRDAAEKFADAVATLPGGASVILAVRHDATGAFTERAQAAIRSIGGKIGLLNQPAMSSYYCIGRKGMATGSAVERISQGRLVYPPEAQPSDDQPRTAVKRDAPAVRPVRPHPVAPVRVRPGHTDHGRRGG